MIPRPWFGLPMRKAVESVAKGGGRLVFYGVVFAGFMLGVTVRRAGAEGEAWE